MQVDKKGAIIRLKKNEILNFEGGYVDRTKLNSFYYIVSSHIEIDSMNPIRELRGFTKSIKQLVHRYTHNLTTILPKHIVLLDYPESISETKKGFFKLEFNFFNKEMNKKDINEFLSYLSDNIYKDIIVEPTIKLKNKRTKYKRS